MATPHIPPVYPSWFRQRIYDAAGTPHERAASFGVSVATVYRIDSRVRDTGSVDALPHSGGGFAARTFSANMSVVLEVYKTEYPMASLQECCQFLGHLGLNPSISAVSRELTKRLGMTYKVMKYWSNKRDEASRIRWWTNTPQAGGRVRCLYAVSQAGAGTHGV